MTQRIIALLMAVLIFLSCSSAMATSFGRQGDRTPTPRPSGSPAPTVTPGPSPSPTPSAVPTRQPEATVPAADEPATPTPAPRRPRFGRDTSTPLPTNTPDLSLPDSTMTDLEAEPRSVLFFNMLEDEEDVTVATGLGLDETYTFGDDTLQIWIPDITEADCTLLISGGETLMIDCGTRTDYGKILRMMRQAGVTHIDRLAITHPHGDHLGSFRALAMNGLVGEVIVFHDRRLTKHSEQLFSDA